MIKPTKRLTTYQKQKVEISELKRKLMLVCTEPDNMEAFEIKAEQRLKKAYEQAY